MTTSRGPNPYTDTVGAGLIPGNEGQGVERLRLGTPGRVYEISTTTLPMALPLVSSEPGFTSQARPGRLQWGRFRLARMKCAMSARRMPLSTRHTQRLEREGRLPEAQT
jgi:hypothetical protein